MFGKSLSICLHIVSVESFIFSSCFASSSVVTLKVEIKSKVKKVGN